MRRRHLAALAMAAMALVACASGDEGSNAPAVVIDAVVHTPPGYDGNADYPLIVLLHGFGSNAATAESYFGFEAVAAQYGFLYVAPDGTPDSDGRQYWNATDACCDFYDVGTDHSTALLDLVHRVQERYSVDPKRIYFVGHSNGGFMAYRMACDHADTVAAIVSLAGATWGDPAQCAPSQPVSVLQIHGTADAIIFYGGGTYSGREHPSADSTTSAWAASNGCDAGSTTQEAALDLDAGVPETETSVIAFTGCPVGGAVELWSMNGGAHVPALSDTFTASLVEFLLAHPRP